MFPFRHALLSLVALALTLLPASARAGGGPENVFVVVNAASWASQTVANHFIELRQIPPVNVFYLDWTAGTDSIEGDAFRQRILGPTLEMIDRRGLAGQIDYIVYSSDLPYGVDLSRDFVNAKIPDVARPGLSINSATYLWHLVFAKSALMMHPNINHYMREARERKVEFPTHGFRSWYGWGNQGEIIEAGGQPYMLSTMLAMTSGRGNSVNEAVSYLKRSAGADGTHPKGTVYFSKTADVRSTTRTPMFDLAVEQLAKVNVGVKGAVISTPLPTGRNDVLGVMCGTPEFSWAASGSKILPGAICENLTSFGGMLTEVASQTPLTEFLRYGAAGSSGTVIEPMALDYKFPSPLIHVHYARGCTLAESYYQAVFSPAQLLIVGDPLCRPWANIPQVQVSGIPTSKKVAGKVTLTCSAEAPGDAKIDRYELFVDGRQMGSTRGTTHGNTLSWDTTTESDGYHELRVVAVDATPIATQGRAILGVTVDNHKLTAEIAAPKSARWDEPLKIKVKTPGMSESMLIFNARVIGKVTGAEGEFEVNTRQLGTGPITLQAVGTAGNEVAKRVWTPAVKVLVEPARLLPPLDKPPTGLARGLVLQLPDKRVVPVQDTKDGAWLTLKGYGPNQPYLLQGYFSVPADDVYQFQIYHFGECKLSIDGHVQYQAETGDGAQRFVPVNLGKGMHRLTITGNTGREPKLRVMFGGPGAKNISGDTFRHAR